LGETVADAFHFTRRYERAGMRKLAPTCWFFRPPRRR
jgi:hypothetical protein